ncbi:hypothetical protein Salat_0854300 [Sesamum alatum]|uniref:CCHC-type domain-containing protein n=1 Tax=Sesamum alatum TaxID=300844 RepID=A0AAE2CQY1_9LAMI|nr:hypothetical protein Salat_0854300 [Sesamum alatum]
MEQALERLGELLVLTEKEDGTLFIPQAVWEGDLSLDGYYLEGIRWGSALRIQVLLYVRQPLVKVLKLQTSTGAMQAVSMTYECLPNFCYTCGILGHIAKYCTKPFEDGFANSGSNPQYDAWLRPQPPHSTYHQRADQPSGDRSNGLAG